MTDLIITTKLTKDGSHNWGAGKMHNLGTTGNFRGKLRRRRIGVVEELSMEATNTSPFKAPVLAVTLLVTPQG